MRFSIGLRLFVSVLLAILAVAAAGIALMRQNVLHSFSEYAANIELDRLSQLSDSVARQYQAAHGWKFLPADNTKRRAWIAAELERLQVQRLAPPTPPAAPVAPVPSIPAAPAAPEPAVPPASGSAQTAAAHLSAPAASGSAQPAGARLAAPATSGLGPAGAASTVFAPPLPPLPPPLVAPAPPAPPAPPAFAGPVDIDQLSLPQRVTLFDAGGNYLAGRVPGTEPLSRRAITAAGRTVAWLAVARVMRPSDALAAAFLGQLKSSLWGIVAASVALSALAAVLLAAHFRKPIGRLAGGARALADGRFDTRLPEDRGDELGELARSFNLLAQRLDSMEQSRRQWVADTSHELRTPLSVLRAQLEAMQDGVRPLDAGTIAAMLRQVLSLNALIDQLYALARADVGALECQRAPLDLWELACDTGRAFEDRLQAAGLTLDVGPAPTRARVLADAERMRQVFSNLLENSARYTAPGGRVALSAGVHGAWLSITLDDSAPGVPDKALPRLAERFYRVDASRSGAQGGAGLGLALCRRILQAHDGELAFAHSPLGGLRATVTIALEQA